MKARNPLDDDAYTGNDEQIDDLKELVRELMLMLDGICGAVADGLTRRAKIARKRLRELETE